MQHSSRWRRGFAALVLVWSTAIAALLPMADAYAEAAAGDRQSHVEQPGSKGCPPAHDEIACQLCRGLKLGGPAQVGSESLAWLIAYTSPRASAEELPPLLKREPSHSPRAPPIA